MYERLASASTTDSGVSTSRTLASGPANSSRTSSSSRCSRSTASKTESSGIGTPAARESTGFSVRTTRRSIGSTRCMYHPSASGSASSRSVSAVGAQSTTMTSQCARLRLEPQLEQRQHLLGTGDDGQLLGRDRVEADDVEHGEQVALDLRPRLLEAELGVDLLHEEPFGDLGRLRPDGRAERVGEGVGRVGREHQRAVAGGRCEGRGPGRDGGLADPALPGEEEDPHD